MRRYWSGVLAFLSFLCWGGCRVIAGDNNAAPDRILFLHMRLKGGQLELVDATAVPGRLKTAPSNRGRLEVELLGSGGESLWLRAVEDPRVRRYEYEDPANPGRLAVKTVRLDEAEFTWRVPALPTARQLSLYEKQPPSPVRLDGQAARPSRVLIGKVELPLRDR